MIYAQLGWNKVDVGLNVICFSNQYPNHNSKCKKKKEEKNRYRALHYGVRDSQKIVVVLAIANNPFPTTLIGPSQESHLLVLHLYNSELNKSSNSSLFLRFFFFDELFGCNGPKSWSNSSPFRFPGWGEVSFPSRSAVSCRRSSPHRVFLGGGMRGSRPPSAP